MPKSGGYMTSKINKVNFSVFTIIWNNLQLQTTPNIHFEMAKWLNVSHENNDKYLLLMAFRSSGKSTMVGLFCAWILYSNPNIRILVMAADTSLARKMVRNVKRIIERHPLTKHLRPEKLDQWASDRFTVNRSRELRDPSMMAKGITSNITGSRADIVICDDVEVPNTCDTAEKREDLRERLMEMEYVLVAGGTQLYVGTPHNYYTIYSDEIRKEIGETQIFLNGFSKLKIPVLNKDNKPTWPERYTVKDIERMKNHTGLSKFKSQMMLEPVNISEGYLNPADLNIYEHNLEYSESSKETILRINGKKILSASAWWDPAFGSQKGDGSVLACVFTDEEGMYWLHHIEYIKNDINSSEDEATAQCKKICELVERFYLPSISIEINGIGKFLPAILRRELGKSGIVCAVKEISSRTNKDIRILEAFEAVLAARALNVHKSVLKTSFLIEMQEWRPNKSSGHDDGLDAVAGALASEPIRLKKYYTSPKSNWKNNGCSHIADSSFEI